MGTMRKDQWNPSLYDDKHSFVSAFGDSLVKVLAPKKGKKYWMSDAEQEIWLVKWRMPEQRLLGLIQAKR